MKKIILGTLLSGLFFLLGFSGTVSVYSADSAIVPYGLTVESMENPIGIDALNPRLSWKSKAVSNESRNLKQSAWQIIVSSSMEKLAQNEGDLWDSGKVVGEQSLNVKYTGKPLVTASKIYWKLRVWDNQDKVSDWSKPAQWTTAVLKAEDWKGKWIAQPENVRPNINLDQAWWIGKQGIVKTQSLKLRREFQWNVSQSSIDNKEYCALFNYAGNKRFEIFVNGKKAGHSIGMVFNPEQMRTIDISDYLISGTNTIAIAVSNDSDQPAAFLGKLVIYKVNKVKNSYPEKVSRRGTLGNLVLTLGTDKNWSVCDGKVSDGWNSNIANFGQENASGWTRASELFAPDKAPWGKVCRRNETVSPLFQRQFKLEKKVKQAILYVSGPCFCEPALNGKKIGRKLLDPAPTKFNKKVLYSTYDITKELQSAGLGDQELEVMLGHGWYDVRSIVTWNFDAASWRGFPKFSGQLHLQYEDGSSDLIITDDKWTWSTSPYLFDCIRQGEIYDGGWKKEIRGNAVVTEGTGGTLVASSFPTTVITKEFKPKSIRETAPGVWVVDLGLNIAGWCRVTLKDTEAGDRIRFRYSERVKEDGTLERTSIEMHFMEGSPSWMTGETGRFQTDYYFCKGGKKEVFEPKFTYNGFQFVEITGMRQKPELEDITACILHTDFTSIGTFHCDNELLNAIQQATLLSYCSNYVDGYPTDCPHREKNGWTGDAHLAAEQAMYNWNNMAAYEKWIGDLRDEQLPDGNLAAIVPTGGWGYAWGNGPAWDSSLVIIPWYLYLYRGDLDILKVNYNAMKMYIDYMTTRSVNSLVSHGLGDWIPAKTTTPTKVTSSGYYYVDTMIVARTAALLGKKDDAAKYETLAENIRNAFKKELYKEDGTCENGSQTAQSTLLHQGLAVTLNEVEKQKAFDRLVDAITRSNGFLDFGILGSKYVFRTLSEYGRTDLVLGMALQEKQPCFADWLKRGAGTLWEDWGDGSSRNHIMFGDISAWFYQALAGINLLDDPNVVVADLSKGTEEKSLAFKSFTIKPQCRKQDLTVPGRKTLTWVEAKVDSPYGPIESFWKWNDSFTSLQMKFTIPVNTTARIILPFNSDEIRSIKPGLKATDSVNGKTIFTVGSGVYEFQILTK